MLKESIKMSWSNIVHNKLRSFLTMLGIVIGVMAIIALITIVQGVTDSMMEQFSSLGTNTLTVQVQGTALKRGLTDAEFQEVGKVDGISTISPTISTKMDVIIAGKRVEDITIDGKNDQYFKRNADTLVRGRSLNVLDVENENQVCVINQDMVDKAFTGVDPLGKIIIIKGISYEVVGIMKDSSSVMAAMSGGGDSVMLPYRNVLSLMGTDTITAFEAYMEDGTNSDTVVSNLEAQLDSYFNYKDDTYTVINMQSMMDMMDTMMGMMQTMLAGIASIALLVGGIGIMNMMLVSVTERTTEIGLRKALGAKPGSIQIQFLTEAVFLSLIGGAIGIVLGLLISWIAAMALDTNFVISGGAIALGAGFSAGVGMIFGWAPARKASRLNPIDALRSV